MADRNSQVSRVIMVLSLIQNARYGLSVREISERLDERGVKCTVRTVYRDLLALECAGIHLRQMQCGTDSFARRWKIEGLFQD